MSAFGEIAFWSPDRGFHRRKVVGMRHRSALMPTALGKLEQELVEQYDGRHTLLYVIIRPGAVVGPGKSALSGE
jgi:hypothetical protein